MDILSVLVTHFIWHYIALERGVSRASIWGRIYSHENIFPLGKILQRNCLNSSPKYCFVPLTKHERNPYKLTLHSSVDNSDWLSTFKMPKPKQFSIRAMNVWQVEIGLMLITDALGRKIVSTISTLIMVHNSPQSKPEELTILAQPATLFSTIVTVVDM